MRTPSNSSIRIFVPTTGHREAADLATSGQRAVTGNDDGGGFLAIASTSRAVSRPAPISFASAPSEVVHPQPTRLSAE